MARSVKASRGGLGMIVLTLTLTLLEYLNPDPNPDSNPNTNPDSYPNPNPGSYPNLTLTLT